MTYRYFNISHGLRGCYMPDGAYMVRVKSRRELHSIITSEARIQDGQDHGSDHGIVGLSKRAISAYCAEVWRRKSWRMDLALPFGPRDNSGAFGIFLSCATRAEYNEYVKQSENDY